MAINFRGYLFDDSGSAIQGATVQLLQESDGAEEASTTTSAAGLWYFNESDQDRYDIKITRGSSIRYIQWNDQISLREIDVRNDTDENTPAATFTNLEDNVSNQVAVFSGANATRADNDEIYLSFKLANSAGDIEEFARMTAVATDVTDGNEDAQIEFDVRKSGTLTKVWTIASSDAGAMSFDMNVDALTIGSGANTDISLTFDATTYDGVITWMEDEDYFKFSDEILMNSTEKILFGDTGTFIHQSSDGVLTITSDTTVDINGAVAFDGALTGITNITLSGTLSDGNYTFDTSGNVSGLGTIGSGAITSSGNVTSGGSFIIGSASIAEAELEMIDGITAGTAAASKAVVLDGSKNIATIGTIGSGAITSTGTSSFATAIQTPLIEYTDGDDAITIADGGGITAAAGITSTAAANSFGATSFGDASITNVNDIALDSISADGTDINIAVSDNSATALTIKQGSDAYLIVDTANSSESVSIGTGISGTAITIGHGVSETIVGDNLTVTGDFTVSGTTTTITSTTVAVADSLLKVAKDQGTSADAVDFGIYGQYGESGTAKWAGIFRDQSVTGDPWTFFDAVEAEPGTTVNVGGTGYDLADISAGGITAADTLTFGSLSDGSITITAFVDEDDMSTDSATLVPTQQSVKAYADSLGASGDITAISSIYNTSLKMGRDSQNLIDFATTDNKIILRVNNANEVELVENALSPVTSDGVALGTTSLMWSDLFVASGGVINFNNGDMTLTHSANTLTAAGGTVATAALTTSTIVASGIVKTDDATEATSTTDGSLQTDGGLSVVKDAVFGDDVFLLTDSAVFNMGAGSDATLTHDGTTGLTIAANPIIVDSGAQIELDSASGILTFEDGGTEVLRFTEGNSGDVTIKLVTNAKDLIFTDNNDDEGFRILDGALGVKVPGEVMTTKISYTDGDDAITIADGGGITSAAGITSTAAANAFGASSFAGDVAVADSKFVEFESAAGTPTTDNTVQGIVIEFLAVEAITQFDAVYVSTTTGRVGRADANDAAKMPVIGIAIEAQGSAGSSVRVLTHGVYRDDGGFGGNMTVGVDLYAPETPGTLTTTIPSDDGDLIQVIGVAIGARSAFINPSLDIIEHA